MAKALIATLEAPLGRSSTCVAVKSGASSITDGQGRKIRQATGTCQCARYGPSGSGPGFKALCRQAGLDIVIGGRKLSSGGKQMARALALPPPMDYAPVEGLDDDLGFFGQILDADMLKASMIAAGGGALGGVVFDQICKLENKDKKKYLDAPWKKGLAALGFGFVGARALWGDPNNETGEYDVRRDLAKGHLGAMGAVIGQQIVAALMSKKEDKPSSQGTGYFQRQRFMHQLADPQVETEPSFADVDVENDNPLGGGVESWIG